MSIIEALNILGFDSFDDLDEVKIKKRYKILMRKNHPDVGGDQEVAKQLNEAVEIIEKNFKQLRKLEDSTPPKAKLCILDVRTYIRILAGDSITVKWKGETEKLCKSNLRNYTIYLDMNIDIVIDGINTSYNNFVLRDQMDRYQIICPISYNEASREQEVTIKVYGESKTLTISSSLANVVFNTEQNIIIKVTLERHFIE